ncbi:Uncharacterized protein Rs2_03309 [Raphanus sativus]|nr:Uncharacterized protein Rs2_03309 [Raphanus sativus]
MCGLNFGDSNSSSNGDGGSRTGGSLTRPFWQHRLNSFFDRLVPPPTASAFHSNALHDGHDTKSHLTHVVDTDVDDRAALLCLRIDNRNCLAFRVASAYGITGGLASLENNSAA